MPALHLSKQWMGDSWKVDSQASSCHHPWRRRFLMAAKGMTADERAKVVEKGENVQTNVTADGEIAAMMASLV